MNELGTVLNTGYSAPVANPTLNGMSNSPEAADSDSNLDNADVALLEDPLIVEIAGVAYPAAETYENVQPQLEHTTDTAGESRYPIHSDVSELVIKLRDEIGAVNSFDGFLLGVYDIIEEFRRYLDLDIKSIREFVQRVTRSTESPQQHESPVALAGEHALAAWQSQANLEPDRVLALLKDAKK